MNFTNKNVKKGALIIKNFYHFFQSYINNSRLERISKEWEEYLPDFDYELTFRNAIETYSDPNNLYRYFNQYFFYRCPQIIRDHRAYFSQNDRGFGENAMHAMWWLLLLHHQPQQCLEIGVYRGQVLSLWALVAKYLHYSCTVYGISPFTNQGDSVSSYMQDIDYYSDVLANFDHFQLPSPILVKHLSADATAIEQISSKLWDLIYIDGSHEYDIVLADYQICQRYLRAGGILVLDDAALFTTYQPPLFAFAGHPGPSRVAVDYAMKEMQFLGGVGHNLIFEKP